MHRVKRFKAWKPKRSCACSHDSFTHKNFDACLVPGCGCQKYRDQKLANKYKAHREEVAALGIKKDSKFEAKVAHDLEMQKKAGEIKEIRSQVDIPLYVNGIKITTYRADFWVEYMDGREEIIEPKGMELPAFKIKWRLLEAIFSVEHPEVKLILVKQRGW